MSFLYKQIGQGLLETIIAIAIIITGLTGSITLVNYTIRSTSTTVNRLIALNLAWEGIEVAINIRDSNYLAGMPWDDLLVSGGDTTAIFEFDESVNIWYVDFAPNTFEDAATVLYQQGGLMRQASIAPTGAATKYKRLIELDNSNPDQIRVVSTVQWTDRGNVKEVFAERTLFNWR